MSEPPPQILSHYTPRSGRIEKWGKVEQLRTKLAQLFDTIFGLKFETAV